MTTPKTPTKKPRKGAMLSVYFADHKDLAAIKAAAKRENRPVSRWCSMRLCEAARKAR